MNANNVVKIKYNGMGNFEVNKVLVTYRQGKVFNTGKLKASEFRKCYKFIVDYMENNHHKNKYDIELINSRETKGIRF